MSTSPPPGQPPSPGPPQYPGKVQPPGQVQPAVQAPPPGQVQYPGQPQYPGQRQRPPNPPLPTTLTVFVILTGIGALLLLLQAVLIGAGSEAPAFAAGVVLGALFSITLWGVFAFLVTRGFGWARITGTVLGGFNALNVSFNMSAAASAGDAALVFAATALLGVIAAAIVLLWLPATSRWFEAVRAARAGTAVPSPPGSVPQAR